MKRKHSTPSSIDWDGLICPITQVLPTTPVIADDGKIYEKAAWEQYVKSNKKKTLKSPWTRKVISKKATFSPFIKQMIEHAVLNGNAPEDMCTSWKQKISEDNAFTKLKSDAVKKPKLFMVLGDHYYNGTGGATRDLEKAFQCYQDGWMDGANNENILPFHKGNVDFFVKMTLVNTLRRKRTNADMICAWASLCQCVTAHDKIATFVVKKVLEKLCKHSCWLHISMMSKLTYHQIHQLPEHDLASNEHMAKACAKRMAKFLKVSASFQQNKSEEENEDDEEDESEEDVNDNDSEEGEREESEDSESEESESEESESEDDESDE